MREGRKGEREKEEGKERGGRGESEGRRARVGVTIPVDKRGEGDIERRF